MGSTENSEGTSAGSTVKKRSPVHGHFKFIEEMEKYKCNYCSKYLAKEKASGTGNLLKHLRKFHSAKLESQEKRSDAPGILTSMLNKMLPPADFKQILAEFIVSTDQPFLLVETESFVNLINYNRTTPVEIPKRDTIKKIIMSMFAKEKEAVIQVLKAVQGKISLVVDCWTTRNGYSFQGIIATFIDSNWNFQQVILDLDVMYGSHKGKKLAQSVIQVLDEFGITEKLLSITSDNASNMDTMFKELHILLKQKGVDFQVENHRVRCLAHVINLACQEALNVLKESTNEGHNGYIEQDEDDYENEHEARIINESNIKAGKQQSIYGKLKKAVNRIRKSNILSESLKHFCEANNLPSLKLLNDMPVRWNSTFKLLERCLSLRKDIDATMKSDDVLSSCTLTSIEWEVVAEMVTFLKPFDEMTMRVSKQSVPLMSLTAAVYVELYNHLESYKKNCGHHTSIILASKMACDKLNDYYPKTDGLVYILGIVLDPRCKYEWHKTVGYEKLVPGYKRTVTDHWKRHYKPPSDDALEVNPSEDIIEKQMKRAKYDSRDEMEKYISERPCKLLDHQNGVLKFWKEHETSFPNLSKLARDYLGVAATGVPIESFFSTGTDLVTPKRLAMLAETIRCILCLKAWLKFKNKNSLEHWAECVAQKMLGDV